MTDEELLKWGQTSLRAFRDRGIRRNLELRAELMKCLRSILDKEDFVEVDTPILRYYEDPTENPPFVTLGVGGWPRFHLRTCPEEYTRRSTCVFDKAYEIGKCFRNETNRFSGAQRSHIPEFTMVEIYEVDVDLEGALRCIEQTVRCLVREVHDGWIVQYQEEKLDFREPFQRIKVLDALEKCGEPKAIEFVAMHRTAPPEFISGEDQKLESLIKKYIEPGLIQPTFLTHFPKSADQLPDRNEGNEVQRAELIVAGKELGEVGALQPDSEILRKHCVAAIRERYGHTLDDSLVDIDYLAELKAFNRAVGGGAIGIDRLLMLLCDTNDIRDVVWYPFVGQFLEGRD